MEVNAPTPESNGRVSAQDSSPGASQPDDPRDIIHAPNEDDPDVDESSSVNDLIKYGHHALTQDGLATRIGYLWRRRAYKSLYLLKQKPRSGRKKGDFADLAESLGYSRSQGYKLAHLWRIIEHVDKWAEVKAAQSKLRRSGIEEWPSDEAILTEFPSPLKPTPRSKEEKEEEKREEEEARARAQANRNAEGDDKTSDNDAFAERVAALEVELEQERTARLNTERMLAREREVTEALNAALKQKEAAPVTQPEEPQGVLSQDSDPRQLDLFAPLSDNPPPPDGPPSVSPIDPATVALSPDAVVPEERDDIERHYKLPTAWVGRSSPNGDIQIRNIRAHFYRSWGAFLSPEEAKATLRLPKRTWRDSATVTDVLTRLAELMAEPETPEQEILQGNGEQGDR